MLLNKIQYTPPRQTTSYPFNLPWQAHFHELRLTQPVTILTGDNGSGKSTLLNAIAANYNAILMSGASLEDDAEYANSRALAHQLKLTWTYRTKSGFLFRPTISFHSFAPPAAASNMLRLSSNTWHQKVWNDCLI